MTLKNLVRQERREAIINDDLNALTNIPHSNKKRIKKMDRKFSQLTSVKTIVEIAEELECYPVQIFEFCLLDDTIKKEALEMIRDTVENEFNDDIETLMSQIRDIIKDAITNFQVFETPTVDGSTVRVEWVKT